MKYFHIFSIFRHTDQHTDEGYTYKYINYSLSLNLNIYQDLYFPPPFQDIIWSLFSNANQLLVSKTEGLSSELFRQSNFQFMSSGTLWFLSKIVLLLMTLGERCPSRNIRAEKKNYSNERVLSSTPQSCLRK